MENRGTENRGAENRGAEISVESTEIEGLNPATAMPSTETRHKLRRVDDILSQYKKLTKDVAETGSLTIKLAREAIFGVQDNKL